MIAVVVCVVKAKQRKSSETIGNVGITGGQVIVNPDYEHKLYGSGSEEELKPNHA